LIDTIATALKKDQSDWCSLIDSVLFTYRVSLNQTLREQGIGGKKIPYIDRVGGRVKLGL
jgi:hypothetical protein